jgi:hypothetical protein
VTLGHRSGVRALLTINRGADRWGDDHARGGEATRTHPRQPGTVLGRVIWASGSRPRQERSHYAAEPAGIISSHVAPGRPRISPTAAGRAAGHGQSERQSAPDHHVVPVCGGRLPLHDHHGSDQVSERAA